MHEASRTSKNSYWGLVLFLVGVGFISILSIGYFFLLMAITLIVLSPFRSRPWVFWPGVVLVLGFVVGYVLVAPLGCTSTNGSPWVCRSAVGVEYKGSPQTPGLIGGGVVALAGATIAWVIARRQLHSARQ